MDYSCTKRTTINAIKLTQLGAGLLALSLIGYAIYELVLWPAAGFPSDDRLHEVNQGVQNDEKFY